MISKLLVGLDGSPLAESVLPYAAAIARAGNVPLVLMRVIPPDHPSELSRENPQLLPFMVVMPNVELASTEDEAARHARQDARQYLDEVARKLEQQGVVVETAVVRGDPAKVLIEEAELRHASLILLTTHGRSGLGRWIYGSVAESVVAHSRIPVFLARAWKVDNSAQLGKRSRILVPLDGTPLAERAVPYAADLARLLGSELSLLEVVRPISASELADDVWLLDETAPTIPEEEASASAYLTDLAQRLRSDGLSVKTATRVDQVSAGIAATADAGAALIVMATHAEPALVQALVGSVALEVLHRAALPVLLVGPAARVPD
jgi:nucleotide-binding universal stress UspA family protein